MNCTAITKNGRKCRRGPACHIHRIQTCVVCLEPLEFKDFRRMTTCRHVFHPECIANWFVMSDDCPVCRSPQNDDPMIQFKKNIEARMRTVYSEAIQSLEDQVARLRRPRSHFPRRLSYVGTVHSNNTPGGAV